MHHCTKYQESDHCRRPGEEEEVFNSPRKKSRSEDTASLFNAELLTQEPDPVPNHMDDGLIVHYMKLYCRPLQLGFLDWEKVKSDNPSQEELDTLIFPVIRELNRPRPEEVKKSFEHRTKVIKQKMVEEGKLSESDADDCNITPEDGEAYENLLYRHENEMIYIAKCKLAVILIPGAYDQFEESKSPHEIIEEIQIGDTLEKGVRDLVKRSHYRFTKMTNEEFLNKKKSPEEK